MTMILTVNCGAPQPYFEVTGARSSSGISYRLRVPITHEDQNHILSLADPLSEISSGNAWKGKFG